MEIGRRGRTRTSKALGVRLQNGGASIYPTTHRRVTQENCGTVRSYTITETFVSDPLGLYSIKMYGLIFYGTQTLNVFWFSVFISLGREGRD